MSGRFAPSPTGDLHLGNLRTAAITWLMARSSGVDFIVRMEDLDRVQASRDHERSQLHDLVRLGMESDVGVIRQSERFDRYHDAIAVLEGQGLVYECFCSRREVRAEIEAAPSAPHLPPGAYPGTCRTLTAKRRAEFVDAGRRPALRLRAPGHGSAITVDDRVAGSFSGGVDDTVLRRNDGVPSYNVAVIVDDAAQGVTQVVRGDDLLTSTPRQIHLQRLLGLPEVTYAHVPLVFGDDGERLSKRHGSVSLAELDAIGVSPGDVIAWIASTLGRNELIGPTHIHELLTGFETQSLATPPIVAPPWISP